jgi:pimeloyl-ACP methyl ester carboxylesterase
MAGRQVFRAAIASPARLARLTAVQAALARLAPGLVRHLLFAGTAQAERRLARDHPQLFGPLLRRSYGPGRPAYLRELAAYVAPWADLLPKVAAPVTLHHGTADSWSPPDMAEALQGALPTARVIRHDGLGHYGTLAAALENEK